jgi:glutamine amidotransferase
VIAVVDYEAGNLTSVETALRYLDAAYTVTSDPDLILRSDKVIFPGVGEARHAMGVLSERGLDEALISFASTGKPLFGICLGCQILQDHSEERDTGLLGLIPGDVKLFPASEGLKVPQIGWNTVSHDASLLFEGIPQESSFYFVHSYYLATKLSDGSDSPWIAGRSDYGITFAAAIHRDNVWATQFHPEKSGPKGLKLLQNFIERIN